MSVFNSIYWQIPVLSQKFMGVWPYNDGTLANKIMPVIFYTAMYCLAIPMCIRMINELGIHNMIALKNLMGEMFFHGAIIKLTINIVYKKELKAVYDLIANDWEKTLDSEELQIMEDYASLGRKMSIFYMISCFTTAGSFICIPTFKPLLDYVIPLENGSRPLVLPYFVEYYIDQEKYYFLLLAQGYVSVILSAIVYISYDISFAMCVQHVCSIFDIISLRLKKASQQANKPFASVNYTYAECQVYKSLIEAVEVHKTIIENVNILEDAYNICWFLILLLNTVVLGGVLVVVLDKVGNIEELYRYSTAFIIIFIHMYYVYLPGQKIINYSLLISDDCYSCVWYQMSARCKYLLRLMMLRSIRPLQLTGGKMFVMCMTTYAGMLKAGMSYFTMLANAH